MEGFINSVTLVEHLYSITSAKKLKKDDEKISKIYQRIEKNRYFKPIDTILHLLYFFIINLTIHYHVRSSNILQIVKHFLIVSRVLIYFLYSYFIHQSKNSRKKHNQIPNTFYFWNQLATFMSNGPWVENIELKTKKKYWGWETILFSMEEYRIS